MATARQYWQLAQPLLTPSLDNCSDIRAKALLLTYGTTCVIFGGEVCDYARP